MINILYLIGDKDSKDTNESKSKQSGRNSDDQG